MTSFGGHILSVKVRDIRFPTGKDGHGSDAMHTDPDYSAAYVEIQVQNHDVVGCGLTFTLGRGTDIVCAAVHALAALLENRSIDSIFSNFAGCWRELTSECQLRWIGPEKGVMHLATAAVVNALWDLWAKLENKPLWKLLADMPPRQLVSTIDFRYITDALTPEEAISILERLQSTHQEREADVLATGYPAYTTSCGWLGYTDDHIRQLCREALADGWEVFKVKVGADLQDDIRRCQVLRDCLGNDRKLMMDANQRWDVGDSIERMKVLAQFKPYWIEEPTSPDDVLGHATIARAMDEYGILVATGEQCQNRVIFKQLLQAKAIGICQIDSCRVGGVNENLAIILMAHKFGVPVVPHAGGVGLCELVQHLIYFDYISVSGKKNMCEFVDHLHEHFVYPTVIERGYYRVPTSAGFSSQMKESSFAEFEYPTGSYWRNLNK